MRLCAWLRAKHLYGKQFADQAALDAALSEQHAPYHCLRTLQPWGPDERVCEPGSCGAQRPCFEPSPREPGWSSV